MISKEQYLSALAIIAQYKIQTSLQDDVFIDDLIELFGEAMSVRLYNILLYIKNVSINCNPIDARSISWKDFNAIRGSGKKSWAELQGFIEIISK